MRAVVLVLGWPLVQAIVHPGADAFVHGPGSGWPPRTMASGMASTHGPRASPLGRPSEAGRVRQTGAARLWAPRASLALPGSVWERRRRGGAGVMHDVRIPGGVGSLFSEELDLSSEEREKILRIEGSMRSSQLRALYFSQFLSGFGDRVWQFAIPFFLLALQRPDSLTFAVFYALVTGFTNIACGPIVSYSVEKFGRLQTITACMLVQITFVSLSFLLTYIALSLSSRWMGTLGFLMLLLTASCSIGSLASFGSTFAIERDWIRCLNNGNEVDIIKSENVLAKISVACRVAAPIFVAVILACLSPSLAALSIALWDLVAVMIEYSILRSIYVTNPRLAAPKEQQKKRKGPAAMSPTQTLVRVAGRQRWFLAYQASWREYLDLDGDGMISSTELSYGVRVGVLRCWDLWIGCICGAGLFVYIRRILALPYAA